MSYYKHHVIFCLNQREDGAQCCMNFDAESIFMYMKKKIKVMGLNGPNMNRINRGGCLDRCKDGPLLVIYPEAVWYKYIDKADIDEIIDKHLVKGNIVTRLLV